MAETTIIDVPMVHAWDPHPEAGVLRLGPGRWEITQTSRADSALVFIRRLEPEATGPTSRSPKGEGHNPRAARSLRSGLERDG